MVTNFRGPIRYIAPVINALSYPLAVSAAVRRIVLAARVNTTDSNFSNCRIAQSGCFIPYSVKIVPKEASSETIMVTMWGKANLARRRLEKRFGHTCMKLSMSDT
jgi:hypothetical protein